MICEKAVKFVGSNWLIQVWAFIYLHQ